MALNSGERQVAPTLNGIRRDHRARYEWAASILKPGSCVVDVGCGIGYGSKILADAGHHVIAVDVDAESIAYAKAHYAAENIEFLVADAEKMVKTALADGKPDAAVCFEMIEHVADPLPMLRRLRPFVTTLLASVPNEDVFPWKGYAFHHRHYTKAQFQRLLADSGFHATVWCGQAGPESPVEVGVNGRTLVAVSVADEGVGAPSHEVQRPQVLIQAPKHVAIVGLGPSAAAYADITKRMGGRRKFCDETWAINALGDVLACDRVFHMDDVRVQEVRAAAAPESNIAGMLEWVRKHPGPIVTSRAHPGYPGLVEFPLEDVVNEFPNGYFNSTAAYAVAYAVHIGVEKISLFGCDFTYPNAHDAEKGRACVEFWLGIASERGIKIIVPKSTSLLDAIHTQADRFYGFDCVDLGIYREGDRIRIAFSEKEPPSAEEVERRYDHTVHPNPLVTE